MSITKLTNDLKCCLTFYPDSRVMQDLATGKMIGSSKQFGGHYHISSSPIKSSAHQVSQSFDLWHLHLGHPSFSRFKFLADQLHLNNATFSHNGSICPLAKQIRLSFPRSSITTHSAFDLLHCDVWGPNKIPTCSGLRFLLTIVDDFTRCTWVFLMQHKSKVHHLLMNFVKFVQTQFHTTIKMVRSDNETEFLSLSSYPCNHFLLLVTLNFNALVSILHNKMEL